MTRHIYATFDGDGFPTGFFPDDWHEPRSRPVLGELVVIPVFEVPEPTQEDPNPEPVQVGVEPDSKVSPNPPVVGEEPNPYTTIPAEAVEISEDQYAELLANEGRRRWDGDTVVPYTAPTPPLPPITISADVLFFDRMTDAEYDSLDAAVKAGESARIYRGWAAATSFTEGTDMWALLVRHLDATVSAARKVELLDRG